MKIKTIFRAAMVTSIPAVLVLTALGAAANPDSGGGDDNSGGRDNIVGRDVVIEVQLIDATRFKPNGLVLAAFGIDWKAASGDIVSDLSYFDIDRPALQRDESKVNIGKVPLLGALFRKTNLVQDTVSDEFRGAVPVGVVSRIDDALLLELLPGMAPRRLLDVKTIVIANGDFTYSLSGLAGGELRGNEDRVPWLTDLPLVGDLFRIGEARQKGSNLLIMIEPHLIELDE